MKRAVIVICDGLRADMVTPATAPGLTGLSAAARRYDNHRSVFPSTTRVTSASIATGCRPGRHGLEGNCVVIDEGDGPFAISTGRPDFRTRMRAARGRTLAVPTMAERLAEKGGAVVYANVSAGAAHFQDPDGFGHLYHRLGSFGPGLVPIEGDEHLDVSHDGAGDALMTERFCAELRARPAPLAVMWLCEPDHAQHGNPLGSPAHMTAIESADACARRVWETAEALRRDGDDVLLVVASDHGHETVDGVVALDAVLIEAGLKAALESTDVVIASNGFSANLYLRADTADRRDAIAEFLRAEDWVGEVFAGAALADVGLATDTGLAIAVTTRKSEAVNPFGIPGLSVAIEDPLSGETAEGCGQHGGLGPFEQHPFLIVSGPRFAPGTRTEAGTSAIDIAPTVMDHLGVAAPGMDGKVLPMGGA